MDMDTDALRWLQQVADGTTLTEVSELEQVTQSGVSRALARLEAQFGTPLLRRSGRTLRLTHAGAVFKPHLDAMLHHLDDGIAAVSQLIDPDTGVVALAFQQSLGTWLVPDLVRSFRAAHGRVRFRLTQSRDEPDFVILDGGNADLELGTRRAPDETTRSRLIAVEPLRLAVRRDHPLARQALVQLAEAADEPFVSLRPASGLRRQTDELCQRAGFRPDVIFEGDDLSNVRGFVAVGLGVAVLPAPRAGSPEAVPGPVAYLEIQDDDAVRQIFLSWSAERRLLPATDLFRRHAIRRAAAGQLPAVALSNERGGVHAIPSRPWALGRGDISWRVSGGSRFPDVLHVTRVTRRGIFRPFGLLWGLLQDWLLIGPVRDGWRITPVPCPARRGSTTTRTSREPARAVAS
jgi:LysR family transcriptional activator of glutamate synthase operon